MTLAATFDVDGMTLGPLTADRAIPLLVQPSTGHPIDYVKWTSEHRDRIESELLRSGAIVFRNLGLDGPDAFRRVAEAISPDLLQYVHRSTPRTTLSNDSNIYTATEYPPDLTIPLHCENAYQDDWPMKLMFFCQRPADRGGETPIAHVPSVTKRIRPELLETFDRKKVMYVRNYGLGIDLSWQVAFQTSQKSAVEHYCGEHSIDFEWLSKDRLRTRQVCQGVAAHPRTQEVLWFNQAHLFHVSSLGREAMKAMTSMFREEDLPRNSYYGDGSPLDLEQLDQIRQAYQVEAVAFPWHPGDVMLVDNMLVAHGRSPFSCSRQVLVAMLEPRSRLSPP